MLLEGNNSVDSSRSKRRPSKAVKAPTEASGRASLRDTVTSLETTTSGTTMGEPSAGGGTPATGLETTLTRIRHDTDSDESVSSSESRETVYSRQDNCRSQ